MTLTNPKPWSLLKSICFRFSFSYFFLFVLYDLVTRIGSMVPIPFKPHHNVVLWVGENILGISRERMVLIDNFVDTTFNYTALFSMLMLALMVTLIWSIIDRRRETYKTLYYWLSAILRFYLGFIMVNYGLIKLVQLQFPEPSLYTLVNTYGNSSPWGLAWSFLGYSKGYNLFMGIVEVMSVFLFFRRTLTFGLIVTLVVTLNVMAINFFYDVPLKIVTTHLVLITLFLMAPNFKSLLDFFFRKKQVSLAVLESPSVLKRVKAKKVVIAAKSLFLVVMLALAGFKLTNRHSVLKGEFTKSKFYGIYEMQEFEHIDSKDSSNTQLEKPWKYLIMEYRGQAQLVDTDNNQHVFSTSIDSIGRSIRLYNEHYSKEPLELGYEKFTDHSIVFRTKVHTDSVKIRCRILRQRDFLLMDKNIRLINDDPYNR